MFLAEINPPQRLLHLSFIGHVTAAELAHHRDELAALMAALPAGFRLLTDLGRLDSMELDCEPEIGWIMDACDRRGVDTVIRIVPDPQKDIGLNIITLFHYHHRVRAVKCDSMAAAGRLLGL